MTEALTIDNYGITAHERYATDQATLELTFIQDANQIPKHLEAAVGKSTLATKWEELFETHLHRHTFANFAPPPNYMMMRNRFFSYSISPDFNWTEDSKDEDEEKQRKEEEKQAKQYKKKIQAKTTNSMPMSLFEKDRSALLNLIDSIQSLNGLLREIHARKVQYQKG